MADQIQCFDALVLFHAQDVHDAFDFRRFDAGVQQLVSAHGTLPRALGEDLKSCLIAGPEAEAVVFVGFRIIVIVIGLRIDLLAQGLQLVRVDAQFAEFVQPFFGIFIRIGG